MGLQFAIFVIWTYKSADTFFAERCRKSYLYHSKALKESFHLICMPQAGHARLKFYQLISEFNLILGMKKNSKKIKNSIFEISAKFDLGTLILVFVYRDIENLRLLCLPI